MRVGEFCMLRKKQGARCARAAGQPLAAECGLTCDLHWMKAQVRVNLEVLPLITPLTCVLPHAMPPADESCLASVSQNHHATSRSTVFRGRWRARAPCLLCIVQWSKSMDCSLIAMPRLGNGADWASGGGVPCNPCQSSGELLSVRGRLNCRRLFYYPATSSPRP
jgi:hypothetical protein